MPSLRARDEMPDLTKLHFCGRLALQTRNAEGLKAILESFFAMPVAIKEFVGEWLRLPQDQVCRLGEARATGTLGMNATLGENVWSCQYKFTIALGPMSFIDYKRLLPGGSSLRRLTAIVRNYIGDELSWNINLILKEQEVPPLNLGEVGQAGWTTWLTPRPGEEDADDLYLDALRVAE
jgi:type VI secretion system protein ImpH